MSIQDIEVGKCYTCGDDGLYKVVAKGDDWLCVLSYSYNHCVCVPQIISEEWIYSDWYEETDEWSKSIFDNLKCIDGEYLKFNG